MTWSWPSFVAGVLASYVVSLAVVALLFYRDIFRAPKQRPTVLPFPNRRVAP